MSTAISRARAKLAPLFDHLSPFLSPTNLHNLSHAYTVPRHTTFRLNTLKAATIPATRQVLSDVETALSALKKKPPARVLPCPWSRSAFMVSNATVAVRHLGALPVHKAGQIHFQSWSSMLAPLCLAPNPGDRVLDMCAAPGGKSCMLAEAVGRHGTVFANEIDPERAKRLKKNVETLLPPIIKAVVHVTVSDARKLNLAKEGFTNVPFDAILLDAPCSGEGIINMSEPSSYKHWSLAWVEKHARLQSQLLAAAHPLLRPGGHMVYSTCTLSPEENEVVVSRFLAEFADMEIVDLAVPFRSPDWASQYANFGPGLTAYGDEPLHPELGMALRVFPTEIYEGFFVVRMRKRVNL
ncbi:hypothetical protein HKX48_003467 [Thoreauomyces humboldtii]|nr:hypothetical protein HKX48_003467 [Thoreauomyces humboldtii]